MFLYIFNSQLYLFRKQKQDHTGHLVTKSLPERLEEILIINFKRYSFDPSQHYRHFDNISNKVQLYCQTSNYVFLHNLCKFPVILDSLGKSPFGWAKKSNLFFYMQFHYCPVSSKTQTKLTLAQNSLYFNLNEQIAIVVVNEAIYIHTSNLPADTKNMFVPLGF